MATPITWQNINAPDNRLAAQLFESAGNSINSGLDRFSKVITDREKSDQVLADRARMATQEEYLNMVQGFKTPEELQAARMSGVLDQRLAALDPRNQAAVRGAVDARVTGLQGQVTANDTFQVNQAKQPMVMDNALADVANGAVTRELARNVLLSRQAVEPITQATALVTAKNGAVKADFDAVRAPGLNAVTLQEDALRGSQVAVDATTTAQRRQDQVIEAELARTSQSYQDGQSTDRLKLGAVAKQLGYPVNAAGAPDLGGMTNEQRLKLDAAAIQAGLTKTSSDLFAGDTKAAEAALANFRKNPNITPEAIARNQAKIAGAFDSTRVGMPVGNDALTLARNQAQADVIQKEKDARNRFAPGSSDALNTYEDLAKELPALVPEDAKEDIPELQRMLSKFATSGIKLDSGQRVTPSAQDIRAAVRSYVPSLKGNVFNSTQAKEIEALIKKDLETSNVTQLLMDAEQSRTANRARDVRNILNGDRMAPAVSPLNPMQLPPPDPKKR